MHKGFLRAGFYLGAVGVMIGAFGAHGLKKMVPTEALAIFETGVKYHMYHALALIAAGFLYKEVQHPFIIWAGRLFMAGIVIFSGSLYLMTLLWPSAGKLGMITPLGGTCFIIGWVMLAFATSKIKGRES